jgi:hypothetical protein
MAGCSHAVRAPERHAETTSSIGPGWMRGFPAHQTIASAAVPHLLLSQSCELAETLCLRNTGPRGGTPPVRDVSPEEAGMGPRKINAAEKPTAIATGLPADGRQAGTAKHPDTSLSDLAVAVGQEAGVGGQGRRRRHASAERTNQLKRCSSLAKRAKNAKTCGAFRTETEPLPGRIWPRFEKEKTNSCFSSRPWRSWREKFRIGRRSGFA